MQVMSHKDDKGQLQAARLSDVRKFGTFSMAYSTLQGGIEEFRHHSFQGLIPLEVMRRRRLSAALGNLPLTGFVRGR